MHSSESALLKMTMKDHDFTLHELSTNMTPVQVSIEYDEQKKYVTMIKQMLQGWLSHYKEVDPNLSKFWPWKKISALRMAA